MPPSPTCVPPPEVCGHHPQQGAQRGGRRRCRSCCSSYGLHPFKGRWPCAGPRCHSHRRAGARVRGRRWRSGAEECCAAVGGTQDRCSGGGGGGGVVRGVGEGGGDYGCAGGTRSRRFLGSRLHQVWRGGTKSCLVLMAHPPILTQPPPHSARAIDVRRTELDTLLALGLPSESIPGRAIAELKARWRETGASGVGC